MVDLLFYQIELNEVESLIKKWTRKKNLSDHAIFISQLEGAFSFALYEHKSNIYFCTRDPLGIKALYYTQTEEGYKFSSNINDLLTLPNVLKKPNLKSIQTMLFHRIVEYKDTMYEGICRLPPGHFMTIKDGKEHIERYWFPEKIKIDYDITEEEAAAKLKELFSKAVENAISDLDKTAFEVSGGLDSSSVVSLLSQTRDPSTIDSYSMDFGELKCDEGKYVDSILEKYPLHHQKISAENLDYHKKYALENLYGMSPNWPITMTFAMGLPMLEKMKKDGKKVIITGQGGDHLFTGTPFVLYDLFGRLKFVSLYQELQAFKKPWSTLKAYILKPILGKKVVGILKKLMGKPIEKLDPFMDKKSDIENLTQKIGVSNYTFKNDLDMITSAAHTTIMDGNFIHCAEEHFDVDIRHPFFDKELVEFALSLPPEMKYRQKTIKWIWRKAMDGILPDMIRDRKDKAEFSEVILIQIDTIDLGALLDDPYIVKLGLIEQSLIDKYRREYEDKTFKFIIFLWTIINVEYWYRYNFEEESLTDLK